MKLLVSLLFLPLLVFCQNKKKEVDLIIFNAKIITGPFTPEYRTMLVDKGKVIGLFNDKTWEKNYTSANKKDMAGKIVLPGFIDAHCHFLGLGKSMEEVNLWGCSSWDETVKRVEEFVKKNPDITWIQGRGWDQNDWQNKNFPSNEILDRLFPNKYILLKRVDGHALIANSKLLDYAGINISSKIEGGKIVSENGKLTGVLIDNATELIENKLPLPDRKQKVKWLLKAQNECVKYGITQVCDAGLPIADIFLIDSLCKANVLNMRFNLMCNPDENITDFTPFKNENVQWKSVKIYSDGALGSRGALLKKPYCDDEKNYGLSLIDGVRLDSLLKKYYNKGLQVCTHSIGDSANALVLKAYSKYLKNKNNRRWRIEHAQVVEAIDLKNFKKFSIIPSVQPTHATSDMGWAQNRICKNRMNEAYIYKTLLKNADYIALGTDFPVEEVNPINTIRAARFRQNANKKPTEGFNLNEKLSSTETFAGMSLWAAKANFWEDLTGTLQNGKYADFIVLNKNPYTVTIDELIEIKVIETYIGGVKF
ncbi:MAG: amidohydrolase [Bacteroidia bacterium]|nr:amidohydrolase [Bacteroidia bacterium]